MKFGLFYEHQVPRPWSAGAEHKIFKDSLDQIELADSLGYDHLWIVEHHFLEEYSHSSAPEIFLGAVSQRTKNMRIGHGICHMLPRVNHPARVAERVATLDILSDGRMEWGTGEGTTTMELEGFNITFDEKNSMWREATEEAANMTVMEPYPGFTGKHFSMPPRNIVPKPVQKPHPPMWLACSRRDSILRAARLGMGALVFGFVKPEQSAQWVEEYYRIIKSDECVPIGHAVNANFAMVAGLSVHPDHNEAVRQGLDGFRFFGYSLGHYTSFGTHQPGMSKIWDSFEGVRESIPDNSGTGGIGTPAEVLAYCKAYEAAGVDQIIFVQQTGKVKHEHICDSLRLFAAEVMPEMKKNEAARIERKTRELAPYIEAAIRRKPKRAALSPDAIPRVKSHGVLQKEATGELAGAIASNDRSGGIAFLAEDPAKKGSKAS